MFLKKPRDFTVIADLVSGWWRYNIESHYKTLLPTNLMVNLTYKCNSKCIMCNIWKMKPKNELILDEWKSVLEDRVFKGVNSLTITGGEAILVNDFSEIVGIFIGALNKLNRLTVISNGLLTSKILENVKVIAKLCKKRRIKLTITISLDGEKQVHDLIRGNVGSYKKVLRTIEELKKIKKEYGFNINVGSLLLKQNISKFEEINKFLSRLGGVTYNFQLVGFNESFLNNLNKEKSLDFCQGDKRQLMKVLDLLSGDKTWMNLNRYYWTDMKRMYFGRERRSTPCPFLKDGLVIDSLGYVFYCLSVRPIGNFVKEGRSVGEIYFDKKNIRIRDKMWENACVRCNSSCKVKDALAYDLKKYLWFYLTGKLWN